MESKIIQARNLAEHAHKGQKRAAGGPYIDHPLQVASLLKEWGQEDEEVICAGLLHDVVEDGNIGLEEIENKFGKRVAFLVDAMSFVLKIKDGKTKKDMDATYRKFAEAIKKEPVLALIKTADMTSNLPNIHAPDNRDFVVNKAYPRLKAFFLPLIKEVGLKKEAKEIEDNFHKYTRKRIKSELYNYLSKEDLREIKKKLSKIR